MVAGLSLSVSIAYGALLYGYSVLVTDEAAGAEFSSTVLSAAFGGAVLSGGATSVVVGRLADRHGVRVLVAGGAVVGGGGLVGFSAATRPWQVLAVWWLVLGPSTAATFYETAYVAIAQWVPAGSRVRAVATLTVLAGLSGPVSIPLAGALVEELGWRSATVVLGSGLAVVGLGVALAVLPGPPPARAVDRRGPGGTTGDLLGDRRFVAFTVASVLAYGALEALIVHRVARFEEAGFALPTVTAWAAASGLATIPGRFALPSLAARLPGTVVLAAVLVIMAGATALAVDGGRPWQLAGHFGLFGVVFGAALPLRAVVMADWYTGASFGRIMGVQAAAVAVGRAAGPAAVGALRDVAGYPPAMVGLVACLLAAAALVLRAGRLGAVRPVAPGAESA